MRISNTSPEDDLVFFKQKFSAIDKDVPLPPSLRGDELLSKMDRYSEIKYTPQNSVRLYIKSAIIPMAACFVLLLGVFLARGQMVPGDGVTTSGSPKLQSAPAPQSAPQVVSYDEAVAEEEAESVASYDMGSGQGVPEEGTGFAAPRMAAADAPESQLNLQSFGERSEVESWVKSQAGNKETAGAGSADMPLAPKADAKSMVNNVACSVKDDGNLYSITNLDNSTANLTVTNEQSQERLSSISLPDMTNAKSIHLAEDNIVVVGNSSFITPISTQVLVYDTTDPEKPKRVGSYMQSGECVASVQSEEGTVYAVSRYTPEQTDTGFKYPQIKEFGANAKESIKPELLMYNPDMPTAQLTVVSAVDATEAEVRTETIGLFADYFNVYCDGELRYTSVLYDQPYAAQIYLDGMEIDVE